GAHGSAPGAAPDAAPADSAPPDDSAAAAPPDSGLPVVYAAALLPGAAPDQDALALEVLSEHDHATYVYRVAPAPPGLSREAAGAWLAALASHTLLALDFMKEPLYLSEDQLLAAREGLYRAALRRLPGLRELRGRLAGRAIHTSPAAWRGQLEKLVRGA
ncbi:MAG TPA: hypothetical protein VMS93_12525, partial [Candidatus Saccharimonadales bacterium]|nr:hypothetical protein [Candidatus Saccharimonadales bacterium]